MHPRLLALLAALALCGLCSARASAQARPLSLLPQSAAMLPAAGQPQDPALRLTAPDPDLWRAQRRARLLLAAGAGMLVGSAVHLSWATLNRVCVQDNGPRTVSLYSAAVVGGVGLSFTIGGGALLGRSTRERRYPGSAGQIVGATALALGSAVVTQALLGVLFALESAGGCAS
jgi:hypothetical protein